MPSTRPSLVCTFVILALFLAFARPTLAQTSTAPAAPAATPPPASTNCRQIPVTIIHGPPVTKSSNPPSKDTDANGRVVSKQSVTVSAGFTPEQMEDDALNHHVANSFGCAADLDCQVTTDKYKSDLIPAAEQAKFPRNKAKYLEIANDAIAQCDLKHGRYVEAEQSLHQALTQAEIWPGKDDSAYPDLWLGLSLAQLSQEHWQDAAASATQAAAIHQTRIDNYSKILSTATDDAIADRMRGQIRREKQQRATALSFIALSNSREGNLDQAANMLEQAYQEAVAGDAPPKDLRDIENFGARLATQTNNSAEAAKWAARADTTQTPQPPAAASPQK
jgi:hypothetical protein